MTGKLLPWLIRLDDTINNTPVAPSDPEVAQDVTTVINWVTWVGMVMGVIGVIIAGAMMTIGQRRGEGGEHASRLGWVLAGSILVGGASGIIGVLI